MKPTERSNWLAEITVISASARKATIDLSDRMDCTVSIDGKVRGSSSENSTTSPAVSSSRAWLASSLMAVPRCSGMG